MIDISIKTIKNIQTYITEHKEALINYLALLENGKATYTNADKYAVLLGEISKNALNENLNGGMLENGILTETQARSILQPILDSNYQDVNTYCQSVQQIFNDNKKLTFNPVNVAFNKNRADGLIKFATSEKGYDTISDRLGESLINFNQSIVTDNIQANADFHYKSGKVKPVIRRMSTGKCCKWCDSKVGVYDYYPSMDTDIFRRHANCRCIVEYDNGTGTYQNVHSRETYKSRNEFIKNLKEKGDNYGSYFNSNMKKVLSEYDGMTQQEKQDFLATNPSNKQIRQLLYKKRG